MPLCSRVPRKHGTFAQAAPRAARDDAVTRCARLSPASHWPDVRRRKLAEIERGPPYTTAPLAIELRRRGRPCHRRGRRGARQRVGCCRSRQSARQSNVIAGGVHALHVHHVVPLLRRHVAILRPAKLIDSGPAACALILAELLPRFPAAGEHQDARPSRHRRTRRQRECGGGDPRPTHAHQRADASVARSPAYARSAAGIVTVPSAFW